MLERGLKDGPGNAGYRAIVVQRGHDQAVTQVEIGLPVNGIVLIRPGHVPDGRARPGHRGEAIAGGAQRVLGIVPLDKQRQRLAVGFCYHAWEEAHPPAVIFHVHAAVQVAGIVLLWIQAGFWRANGAQWVFGKVVVVHGVRGGAPHEIGAVDLLTGGAQLGALLQVEHLPADDDRLFRIACCLHRAQHGVRLDGDVIVHVQDEGRIRILQRLVHDAGIATGTAEVALAEFAEAIIKVRYRFVVTGLIGRVLVALVRHEDEVDDLVHDGILG